MAPFGVNPPTNRLIGDMPKIGIRPTIDGRLNGVREALEDQTMGMARTAARFTPNTCANSSSASSRGDSTPSLRSV